MDFLIFIIIIIPFIIHLPGTVLDIFHFLDVTIWILIILEVSFKLWALDHRLDYLKHNWEDMLVVLLPALPDLKIIKEIKLIKGLRLVRAAAFMKRIHRRLEKILLVHFHSLHLYP